MRECERERESADAYTQQEVQSEKKSGRRMATACNIKCKRIEMCATNKGIVLYFKRWCVCMHLNVSWLRSLNCIWQCGFATTFCLPACAYLRSMFLSS